MTDRRDKTLVCRQCGNEFLFSASDQEFFEQRGLSQPRRCKDCRSNSHKKDRHFVCFSCGNEITSEISIFCGSCHASDLASTQLELGLNNKQTENALLDANTKLATKEEYIKTLEHDLAQKDREIRGMEQTVKELHTEVKELRNLQKSLRKWFKLQFDSLEQFTSEKADSVIHNQHEINEQMIRLLTKADGIDREMNALDIIKKTFKKNNRINHKNKSNEQSV